MLEEFGIHFIRMDLPFRLNHVNCFLAEGEKGWKIIDTGLHNKETVRRWEQELAGKQVTDIIITHYHPDHFGYAGGLQEKYGADVHMSKIDAHSGLHAWELDWINKLHDSYALAGIPVHIANDMVINTKEFIPRVAPYPTVNHYLEEGQHITIGSLDFEVFFTPGHSDGLVVFFQREKRILLSTDHILPRITPNISYWFHGERNPLKLYFSSLEKIRALNADLVVPSHGEPFYDANQRIDEIIAHHEERLDATRKAVEQGNTVFGICRELFPHIKTIHEMRFAIGETIAHLEYLREKHECVCELRNGVYWYYR